MYITKQSVTALANRVKSALSAPQPVMAYAHVQVRTDDEQSGILEQRLRRIKRQSRRQIGAPSVRSTWY